MGLRSTKDNGMIVLLEALVHMVSLDLRLGEDIARSLDVNTFAKSFAVDSPDLGSLLALDKKAPLHFEALTKTFSVDKTLVFEEVQGFDMLVEAIMSDMCDAVSSMSLWLLLELNWIAIVARPSINLSQHIVRVLDMPRMSVKRKLMCLNIIRSWLLDLDEDDRGQQMRILLRDSGIMTSLVTNLENGGPAIARESLLTLAALVTVSERLKHSFESRVGFSRLAHIVSESALFQPKPAIDVVLIEALFQMASLGPIQHGIVSVNFRVPPKLAPWVLQCNAILNVRRPAPLYVVKMTFVHIQETPAGMSNAETYAKSETASLSRRSEFSRRSEGSSQLAASASERCSRRCTLSPNPESLFHSRRQRPPSPYPPLPSPHPTPSQPLSRWRRHPLATPPRGPSEVALAPLPGVPSLPHGASRDESRHFLRRHRPHAHGVKDAQWSRDANT
jgi:hypothetical protein